MTAQSLSKRSLEPGLSITALFTAQTWHWAKFDGADLLASKQGRDVFNITNLVLGFLGLFRRNAPSLRHSLLQRHAIIDHLLAEARPTEVLELAAGLSRRGLSVTRDPSIRYVEVDLEAVIEHKVALLRRTARGREAVARSHWVLEAGDVRSLALDALVERDGPLVIIAEGIFMYFQRDQQLALWRRIAKVLAGRPGSKLLFDLVPFCEQPQPGRAGRFLEKLFKFFTKGSSFAFDERDRSALISDLREAGFGDIQTYEPSSLPPGCKLPNGHIRTQTLVFECSPGRSMPH